MRLGGLNPLMRCHEQRKVQNLTAPLEHSFETSSSSYTKKVSVPRRSCGWIERSLMERPSYPDKPFWNPLSLSMEGGELNGNDELYAGACILYIQASGRLFLVYVLGLTTSRDRFWVILLWQDSERAKSFAAYALAFTGTSDIKIRQDTLSALMSLIHSYTGSFGRCSTQKTVCTLPCKEMQAQFERLAGHGQWSWQQRFGAWDLSLTQVRPRNHNTQGRDTEVHQHIQALSRIWTKCGKKHLGKHPSHLPACDAESVCAATSRKSWLALPSSCRAPSVGKWTSCNLYTLKIPNRFGGSQERSIQCYWYIPIYIEIDVKFAKWIN